jgi:hypothetical protein
MRKRSLPDIRIGITVVSLQAAGTKFSDHIRLYMDSRNSLPVGEDERELGNGHNWGLGMCCHNDLML